MNGVTLQLLLNEYFARDERPSGYSFDQLKALGKLSVCRTARLGGHVQYCSQGHLNGVWYNSCKNRACPQCRGIAREEWLLNTQRVLLDCPHHHVVFTLPSDLNDLWRFNRKLMSDILFKAVHDTLKLFSRDTRYFLGTPGILSVLHTWGRDLCLHPHLHVLISHGGLDSQGRWVEPKKKHLFPQKPVMMVYRGKLLSYLKAALGSGDLQLPPDRREHHVQALLNKLGRQDWVVHFCQRYDYADGVAKYLSRYIKGGPFKNGQLSRVGDEVGFSYYSHQRQQRERMVLDIESFVRRLAQHVPVPGQTMTRYVGLYSSASRLKLNQARDKLGQTPVTQRQLLQWQLYLEGKDLMPLCETCGLPLSLGGKIDEPLIA